MHGPQIIAQHPQLVGDLHKEKEFHFWTTKSTKIVLSCMVLDSLLSTYNNPKNHCTAQAYMEQALWSLEDKWKLSTRKAIAIFVCASFLAIGICVVGALRRRKSKAVVVSREPCKDMVSDTIEWRAVMVREVLLGSERWSEGSKWEDGSFDGNGSRRVRPTSMLVRGDVRGGGEVGWQSHNSTSAVWQRPILMGEKCELPRFSGLIMYDQRGMPLHHFEEGITIDKQDKKADVAETTFRDLLLSSPPSTTERDLL